MTVTVTGKVNTKAYEDDQRDSERLGAESQLAEE